MDRPVQIEAKNIGASGCYYTSIINGMERMEAQGKIKMVTKDIILIYEVATDNNWMDQDCYLREPARIVGYILGESIDSLKKNGSKLSTVRHESLDYKPKDNEIELTRYEREATGVTYSHFVETRDGKVLNDPYGTSNTVTFGHPVSKRIITIKL